MQNWNRRYRWRELTEQRIVRLPVRPARPSPDSWKELLSDLPHHPRSSIAPDCVIIDHKICMSMSMRPDEMSDPVRMTRLVDYLTRERYAEWAYGRWSRSLNIVANIAEGVTTVQRG